MKFSERPKKEMDPGENKHKCFNQAKCNLITQTTRDINLNFLTQCALFIVQTAL